MTRLRLLLALVAVLGVACPARAMGQEPAPPSEPANAPRDPGTTAAVALALKVVASAASAEAEVDRLLATARKDSDVVMTAYLSEKKSQINVVGKIAQARRKLLVAAAGRGDKEVAKHLAPLLALLDARLTELKTQAHEGVGKAEAAAAAKHGAAHSSDDTRSDGTLSDDEQSGGSAGSTAATGVPPPIFWVPAGSLNVPPTASPSK